MQLTRKSFKKNHSKFHYFFSSLLVKDQEFYIILAKEQNPKRRKPEQNLKPRKPEQKSKQTHGPFYTRLDGMLKENQTSKDEPVPVLFILTEKIYV